MIPPGSKKLSWGADGKTAVQVPTSQSQQRLKTSAKPELRWDEDASTVLRPVDAIIPAAAFRDDAPEPRPVAPAPATPEAPSALRQAPAEPELVIELEQAPELQADTPVDSGALSSPESPAPGRAATPTPRARFRTSRWLMLGLLMALFYAGTYFGVSVVRKLAQHREAVPPGSASLTVWDACGEVFDDLQAKVKAVTSRAR